MNEWIEIPQSYEEWRQDEIAFMPEYWKVQQEIASLPPPLRFIVEMTREWNFFKDRPLIPDLGTLE